MLPAMHGRHSSDKIGLGRWFLLLPLCLLLWSELCYMPSHRQNKSLCLPRSRNGMVTEAELPSPLRKLAEIISSIHFSQVLPCSLGRNYHYKQPPVLQKRHIWLEIEFSTRSGWSPEKRSTPGVKWDEFVFLSHEFLSSRISHFPCFLQKPSHFVLVPISLCPPALLKASCPGG